MDIGTEEAARGRGRMPGWRRAYLIFEGRLKASESRLDNPTWVKLPAGLLLAIFVLYVA